MALDNTKKEHLYQCSMFYWAGLISKLNSKMTGTLNRAASLKSHSLDQCRATESPREISEKIKF